MKVHCPKCGSRFVHGRSPLGFQVKRYKGRKCIPCGYEWTDGHRGLRKQFQKEKP